MTEQDIEITKPIEVFLNSENGNCVHFDITLPIQMLFDDVINFVTTI